MRERAAVEIVKGVESTRWRPSFILAGIFTCILLLCPQLRAQQAGQPPATPANKIVAPAAVSSTQPSADPKVPADDRIFWTLPNRLTVENSSALPPLTPGAKIMLIGRDTFDPFMFAFIGLEAGVNQASNSDPSLRQGLKGYAK